ncbi:hypothetical protein K432DRAFT_458980 [Lepidopterella palustris CBS 459.81]|uniref:Uncharacterized protein n=1 Tax=Lepidopterella palustris CBS 459.81 TaxID=1314670 RepID=A0A8E2EJI3_9PEZI|nr:hypothetical protein K432DRAFT_458980 [Lepidopterella palustris CBS 459.81]
MLAYSTTQKPAGRKSGITDQEQDQNVVEARTVNHERRKKELLEVLEPALGLDGSDTSTIFVCWGKENRCHIVPVQIPNFANDVAIWQAIRRAWYKHRWEGMVDLFPASNGLPEHSTININFGRYSKDASRNSVPSQPAESDLRLRKDVTFEPSHVPGTFHSRLHDTNMAEKLLGVSPPIRISRTAIIAGSGAAA